MSARYLYLSHPIDSAISKYVHVCMCMYGLWELTPTSAQKNRCFSHHPPANVCPHLCPSDPDYHRAGLARTRRRARTRTNDAPPRLQQLRCCRPSGDAARHHPRRRGHLSAPCVNWAHACPRSHPHRATSCGTRSILFRYLRPVGGGDE